MNVVSTISTTDANPPTAPQKRAEQPLFVSMWSIQALLSRLPLLFPVDPNLPPSPKTHYRSDYRCPEPATLLNKAQLAILTEFEIALYLIDFSPLERLLAKIYVDSHKGQVPFHPVSLFLCICLRREQNLKWAALAKLLAGSNGAGWRALFGFREGNTPSASGLRYFFNAVGPKVFDDLCPRFIELLRQHGLLPEHSTYPGDPPDRGVTVTQDGQLHPARSRPSCQLAIESCYEPLASGAELETGPKADASSCDRDNQENGTVGQSEVPPRRPCRARDKGLPGCLCDTPACQERCDRASVLDPDARFIHYEGHNNATKTGSEAKEGKESKSKGIDVFGFRSVVDRILDDRFAVAWTAKSSLYPANTDERSIFVERVKKLQELFPDLKIGEWLDDAGVGYAECLNAIWEMGALRMVEIRADASDKDFDKCVERGYDEHGHPLCPHGYHLHHNGYDYERRRGKHVCRQACRKESRREGETVCVVEGCPYLDDGPLGFIINVRRAFANGSMRLVREIPYGTEEWDKRYGRRNLSESRNGQMDGMGLKRMQSYGLERDTKDVQVADFVINLRTLGRLVREATKLSEG